LKQIPHAVGYDKDFEGNQKIFDGFNLSEYAANLGNALSPGAIIVTLVSLAILLTWDKVSVLKKLKMLPGALVAVVAGIALNELFKGTSLEIAKEHLVNLPVPQSAEDLKNLVTFPDFSGFTNPKVWILGATIAIVASIETLLCIEASDRMDVHKRITDTNL
jgi:MFS superfamily sulfate permease-like transporter